MHTNAWTHTAQFNHTYFVISACVCVCKRLYGALTELNALRQPSVYVCVVSGRALV